MKIEDGAVEEGEESLGGCPPAEVCKRLLGLSPPPHPPRPFLPSFMEWDGGGYRERFLRAVPS